jgi:hypothetical protein
MFLQIAARNIISFDTYITYIKIGKPNIDFLK